MAEALLMVVAKCQCIGGTIIVVIGVKAAYRVFAPVFFVGLRPAPVVIHLRAAVSAVEQARQRVGLPGGVCAVDGLSDLLGQFPSLRVYNGLMGMLEW